MDILIEQETGLHQYEVRQNKSEVMRLLHPSFREVGKSGNSYDYQNTVEMMEHEKPSKGYIHSQEYECIQVELSVQLCRAVLPANEAVKAIMADYAETRSLPVFQALSRSL